MSNSKRRKKLLVFLSHAREDTLVIHELCNRLRDDGFDPWLDKERLLPGQKWDLEIERAMMNSDVLLLCFSEKSVSKEGFIQHEYKKAIALLQEKPEGTIFVIPVRLDRCDIPKPLRELQCVDFPTEYDKLVLSLNKRAAKTISSKKSPKSPIHDSQKNAKQVQLVLEGNFQEFTKTKQGALILLLAAMLRVDSESIRILQVRSGSITVVIEMPEIAVNRLRELAMRGDFRLKGEGIISIQVAHEQVIVLSNLGIEPKNSGQPGNRAGLLDNAQGNRVAVATNGIMIGGDAQKANIILGNENTVIQVINYVYDQNDLGRLVRDTFPDLAQLLELWRLTFPAVGPTMRLMEDSPRNQPAYETVIDDFKQSNELARLLAEIKKRNLDSYRNFLGSQVLKGIGLSAQQTLPGGTDMPAIEQLLRLQQGADYQNKGHPEDSLEFEDRRDLLDGIRFEKSDHIVLHGPNGVGKTYFLKHLQTEYSQDTRCTFIDLTSCKPQHILPRVVEQLGGEIGADEYLALATVLHKLLNAEPHIHRFYFLFDNADQNKAAIKYLFSPDSIIEHKNLRRFLKGWGILGNIRLKIVMTALHPIIPFRRPPAFSIATQIKMQPLKKHSVQRMLETIVVKRNLPKNLDMISDISDKVYYLAGGHPKCTKQMLLALADKGCVISSTEEWQQLYNDHVIPTIYAEMLKSIDFELLSVIWNLSIFRRFDPPLLKGLLDREILPSVTGDNSRRASELRATLETINLFDADRSTATTSANYVMRHALSLNMQLNAPDRYKMLHSLALEMYLERIQGSEAVGEKQIERMSTNMLDLLFHCTKLLELEALKENQQNPTSIRTRILGTFERYLLLALTMIQKEDQLPFCQFLKQKWDEDEELQEDIRRVTIGEECLHELMQILEGYADQLDEPGKTNPHLPEGGRDESHEYTIS